MTIEILALCEAATTAAEGKMNLLGAFDTLRGRKFPMVHPHCAIALRLRFSRLEEGKHEVRIAIVDDDGKAIMPELQGKMQVRVKEDEESVVANLVINIQQLRLNRPGNYNVNLAVDSRHQRSLPLNVKAIANPE